MTSGMIWEIVKYHGVRIAWVAVFILLLPVSLLWVKTHPFGGGSSKRRHVPLLQRTRGW